MAALADASAKHLGASHPATVAARASSARARYQGGDYQGAAADWSSIVEAVEDTQGPNHPRLIEPLRELGNAQMAGGALGTAELQIGRATALARQMLGPRHRETVSCRRAGAHLRLARGDPAAAQDALSALLTDLEDSESGHHAAGNDLLRDRIIVAMRAQDLEQAWQWLVDWEAAGSIDLNTALLAADLAVRRGDLGGAAERIRALKPTVPAINDVLTQQAIALSVLEARLALATGNLGRARRLVEAELVNTKSRLPRYPGPMTDLVLTLAEIENAAGRPKAARQALQGFLTALDAAYGEYHPLRPTIEARLVSALLDLNELAAAEALGLNAVSSLEQRLGFDHPSTAQSLETLSRVYIAMGRYRDARLYLERASEIRGRETQPVVSALASRRLSAQLAAAGGDFDLAESILVPSLRTAAERLGSAHPLTQDFRLDLAELRLAQAEWQEAGRVAGEVVQNQRLTPIQAKTIRARTASITAAVRAAHGRPGEAAAAIEAAVRELESAAGQFSQLAVPLWVDQARYLAAAGQGARAGAQLRSALSNLQVRLGADHPEAIEVDSQIARLEVRSRGAAQATPRLLKNLEALGKKLGTDHPRVVASLRGNARALAQAGDFRPAADFADSAIRAAEKSLGPNHPDLADALVIRANLDLRIGRLAPARTRLQRALSIAAKTVGPQHELTLEAKTLLAEIDAREGNLDEAAPPSKKSLSAGNADSGRITLS